MKTRKLPLGIQSFEEIRKRGCVYIDKTAFIYRLAEGVKYCFLSRPRRFGKSLLVSTFKAYFEGRKALFDGLAISSMENDWCEYPVIHIDFAGAKYADGPVDVYELVNRQLSVLENQYGATPDGKILSTRLANLITASVQKTGRKAVVLIDEYDAPLLDTMHDPQLFAKTREVMRDFYSPLKENDFNLQFVFLTGITKFSQLSIFSEFNNLKNISMDPRYGAICGISRDEMIVGLKPEIEAMAEHNHWSFDETVVRLTKKYDGYHFSENSSDIFNPFSLLNSLDECKLGDYWFSSGTPTFLAQQISLHPQINADELDMGFWASSSRFDIPSEKESDIVPILYQAGYLTIKGYDPDCNLYLLSYPNEEVRVGFSQCLLPYYGKETNGENETFAVAFTRCLKVHDIDGALKLARAFISEIPYTATRQDEAYYRTLLLLLCRFVTPFFVRAEQASAAGRADLLIETKDAVFCFEFKIVSSAKKAVQQIEDRGYLIPYSAGNKKCYQIGVKFDLKKRTLGKWEIVED